MTAWLHRKRDTQVQKDGQTVYKPAKKAKNRREGRAGGQKARPPQAGADENGQAQARSGEKEEKAGQKTAPALDEPEQKLTGQGEKGKGARRRRRPRQAQGGQPRGGRMRDDDRAADGGVPRCSGCCSARPRRRRVGYAGGQAVHGHGAAGAAHHAGRAASADGFAGDGADEFPLRRGRGGVYTVSPERGARQAMFYAMGLAAMLVMSEIVFHVRHFRGLTLLGMALGIGALILAGLRRMEQRREELVSVPLLGSFPAQRNREVLGGAGAGVFLQRASNRLADDARAPVRAACLLLLMMQRDLGTAPIYYLDDAGAVLRRLRQRCR